MKYEVNVGNIGMVYSGSNHKTAQNIFSDYVVMSQLNRGRAAGENVYLIRDGNIAKEYTPKERNGVTKITMTVFCLEEDTNAVVNSLSGKGRSWYFDHDCPLMDIQIKTEETTEVSRDDF